MKLALVASVAASLISLAVADFKIVQVDGYPAWGGVYGGTSATGDAVATAGGDVPSCGASAGDGFGCDGCGFIKNNDETPADAEVGLTDPFQIVGDGGGDFCEIPSMTCSGSNPVTCIRDDDGTVQATCLPDPGFDPLNCDNIDGTSSVFPFLACTGLACG